MEYTKSLNQIFLFSFSTVHRKPFSILDFTYSRNTPNTSKVMILAWGKLPRFLSERTIATQENDWSEMGGCGVWLPK